MVRDWVQSGGRAVALQPSPSLASALGVRVSRTASGNGFVRSNLAAPWYEGLPEVPLQYFGYASYLQASGEQAAAELLESDRYSYGGRAVVIGKEGRTAVFAYDLIGTILTLRFGLAWERLSTRDAWVKPPIFYRHVVDPRHKDVPQADVHGDYLVRALEIVAGGTLPRVWPLPYGAPAALVLTCDGDDNQPVPFEPILETLRGYGAKITFYLMPDTQTSREMAAQMVAEGHSVGLHPWVAAGERGALGPALARQLHEFVARSEHPARLARLQAGQTQAQLTVRAHGLQTVCRPTSARWAGCSTHAAIYAEAGLRMELNCYSVPPFQAGYMNGSALPLRFLDSRGQLVECFQQATQFADDILVGQGAHSVRITGEEAGEWLVRALAESREKYHGAIVVNVHPHHFARSRPMLERALQFCAEKDLAVLDAESWCRFCLARRQVGLEVQTDPSGTVQVRGRTPQKAEGIAVAFSERFEPEGEAARVERTVHGRRRLLATYPLGPEWQQLAQAPGDKGD
jgi:hypothetical protein